MLESVAAVAATIVVVVFGVADADSSLSCCASTKKNNKVDLLVVVAPRSVDGVVSFALTISYVTQRHLMCVCVSLFLYVSVPV